jgi:hypothetical protein
MSLAFADRDFYYGDPYFPPEEPIQGLLDKNYAKKRAALINPDKNDPNIGPGDPYPFEGKKNPYLDILKQRGFNVDSTNKINPELYQNMTQRMLVLCLKTKSLTTIIILILHTWTGFGAALPQLKRLIKMAGSYPLHQAEAGFLPALRGIPVLA